MWRTGAAIVWQVTTLIKNVKWVWRGTKWECVGRKQGENESIGKSCSLGLQQRDYVYIHVLHEWIHSGKFLVEKVPERCQCICRLGASSICEPVENHSLFHSSKATSSCHSIRTSITLPWSAQEHVPDGLYLASLADVSSPLRLLSHSEKKKSRLVVFVLTPQLLM